jgi:L-iditol 2-dehydrogenase
MKSLICYSKEDIRIEDVDIPEIGGSEALIKTIFCGLCGSDIVKIINPEVKKPTKLGHEVVGIVEKTGKMVSKIKKGDIIAISHHIPCYSCNYCLHGNYSMCKHFGETNLDPQGFSEYIRLTEEHVKYNTFTVKDENNLKNAVFTEPAACCLRAIEKIPLKRKDKVMVIGCGTIGIIFIGLLKTLYDASIAAIDIDDAKLEIAGNFGADLTVNSKIDNVKEKILKFAPGRFDAAVLTFTVPDTLDLAMSSVREGGSIQIFAGPSKERKIAIDFDDLYKKELTIFSSYSSDPESMRKSFDLLVDKKLDKLDFAPLISNILPIEEFKKGLDLALSQKSFKILYYFDENLMNSIIPVIH